MEENKEFDNKNNLTNKKKLNSKNMNLRIKFSYKFQ